MRHPVLTAATGLVGAFAIMGMGFVLGGWQPKETPKPSPRLAMSGGRVAKYIGKYQVRMRLLSAVRPLSPTPTATPNSSCCPEPSGSECLLSRCRCCFLGPCSLSNPTATTHVQALWVAAPASSSWSPCSHSSPSNISSYGRCNLTAKMLISLSSFKLIALGTEAKSSGLPFCGLDPAQLIANSPLLIPAANLTTNNPSHS